MKTAKIIELLKGFSKPEINRFEKYLESPYHNRREDVLLLFHFIKKRLQHRPFLCKKEELFAAAHPKTAYKESKYFLLVSRLFKLAEDFLLQEEFQQDELLKKRHLIQAYRKRKKEKYFKAALKDAQNMMCQQPLRNAFYLKHQYELEAESYDYHSQLSRIKTSSIDKVQQAFDYYFFAEKLKNLCLAHAHTSIKKQDKHIDFAPILNWLEQYPESQSQTAIAVYLNCYKITMNEDDAVSFEQLKQLLHQKGQQFPLKELRDIYLLAINFCIRQMNKGNQRFKQEAFQLYQAGLANQALLMNGRIDRFTYNNIITLALQLHYLDWVENFILQYDALLDYQHQDIRDYNLAKLRMAQQQRLPAIRLLLQFKPEDELHYLGAQILLMKLYYELNDFDNLERLLANLKASIRRRKNLNEYKQQYYKSMIKAMELLLKMVVFDEASIDNLKQQIHQINVPSERAWFLRQLRNNKLG